MTTTIYQRGLVLASLIMLAACAPAPRDISLAELEAEAPALAGQTVRLNEPVWIADNYRLPSHGRALVVSGDRWFSRWQRMPQAGQVDARPPQFWLAGEALTASALGFDGGDADAMAAVRIGSWLHDVQGVVRQQDERWVLELTGEPRFEAAARPPAPRFEDANLTVATFNLLNFFNGDGQGGGFPTQRGADSVEAYRVQKAKLVAAIHAMDADALALAELENDGFGPQSAVADLLRALNAGQPEADHYQAVTVADGALGDQVIVVGIIYRPARLRAIGEPATLTSDVFGPESRPALAASFQPVDGAQAFTLVSVHLKSKGGCDDASGGDVNHQDDRGCYTATRSASAQQLLAWLERNPTGVNAPAVIAGDFNAYPAEPAMQVFAEAGYRRAVDLSGRDDSYSYVYRGRAGSIDHILLAPALQPALTGADAWAINADEVRTLAYDSWPLDAPITPWRSSDHNPVVAGLRLSPTGGAAASAGPAEEAPGY